MKNTAKTSSVDVIEYIKNAAAEVADIDQQIKRLDEQRSSLDEHRNLLRSHLGCIRSILDTSVGESGSVAPVEPETPITVTPKPANDEAAAPAKPRSGAAKAEKPAETMSAAMRVREWCLRQETPFKVPDVVKAFPRDGSSYVRSLVSGLVSRRDIVRVEGNRYIRHEETQRRTKPKAEPAPQITNAPAVASAATKAPTDKTKVLSKRDRVLAWANDQEDSFTYSQAVAAFPDIGDTHIGVILSVAAQKGQLTKLARGEYQRVLACPPKDPLKANEEASVKDEAAA